VNHGNIIAKIINKLNAEYNGVVVNGGVYVYPFVMMADDINAKDVVLQIP